MKRIFFLYVLYLALFATAPAYGICIVDLMCDHDRAPGGALQFFLLENVGGGPFVEVDRAPTCSFPAIPFDAISTFIACAQEGTQTACDTLNPLTLACAMQ